MGIPAVISKQRSALWFRLDVVVAAALGVVVTVSVASTRHGAGPWVIVGLVNATTVVWRRYAPVTATIVAGVTLAAVDGSLDTDLPALAIAVALNAYMSGRQAGERGLRWADAILPVIAVPIILVVPDDRTPGALVSVWLLVIALPIGAGIALGNYARLATRLEVQQATLRAEQRESARRAVARERDRIARELHDVVAHNVSVMVIQTQAARRRVARDRAAAEGALGTVEACGRQALNELRLMIGTRLHVDLELTAPGLGQLAELADQASSSGVSVETAVSGTPRTLSPEIDLAAFRIVQESLTNVIKHTTHTKAKVTLHFRPDTLDIEVVDWPDQVDTIGPHPRHRTRGSGEHSGYGLAGLRERATLHGGTFEAGPGRDGWFRVAASLPLPLEVAR